MDSRCVVLDLGNVLIDWQPQEAIAVGVGHEQAQAFLDAVDFRAWNHRMDSGGHWDDGEAWLAEHHPEWLEHGRAYRRHFAASLVGLVDGTERVVHDLRDAGVPVFGFTNWSAELWPEAPPRFPVLGLLDDVVVSGQVGAAKPDPEAYAVTAERIGHQPAQIFFTDDKDDNVRAAREAGWDAEVFTDASALRAQLEERGLLSASSGPS